MTYEVANQTVRNGAEHSNKSMTTGRGPQPGMRGSFATAGTTCDTAGSVTAGTLGGPTGPGGKNQTVSGSAPSIGAGFKGGGNPTPLVDKTMKVGKGKGAKTGIRNTFI